MVCEPSSFVLDLSPQQFDVVSGDICLDTSPADRHQLPFSFITHIVWMFKEKSPHQCHMQMKNVTREALKI